MNDVNTNTPQFKPDRAVETAARIVSGQAPKAETMNRRDAMRVAAFVAVYAVDQAARKITGENNHL